MTDLKSELAALRAADPQDQVAILNGILRDFSRLAIARALASERQPVRRTVKKKPFAGIAVDG